MAKQGPGFVFVERERGLYEPIPLGSIGESSQEDVAGLSGQRPPLWVDPISGVLVGPSFEKPASVQESIKILEKRARGA